MLGLENHILNAKTLCYAGAIPQGLDSYLIDHNRSLCLPCRKIFTRRPSCLSCNFATTRNRLTPSSTRSDIHTPIIPEAIIHNLPQIEQAALSVLPEVQPTIQLFRSYSRLESCSWRSYNDYTSNTSPSSPSCLQCIRSKHSTKILALWKLTRASFYSVRTSYPPRPRPTLNINRVTSPWIGLAVSAKLH
jgi:hypothetical protein